MKVNTSLNLIKLIKDIRNLWKSPFGNDLKIDHNSFKFYIQAIFCSKNKLNNKKNYFTIKYFFVATRAVINISVIPVGRQNTNKIFDFFQYIIIFIIIEFWQQFVSMTAKFSTSFFFHTFIINTFVVKWSLGCFVTR